MLKKNKFNKIFSKLLLSITYRIESFFNFLKLLNVNKKKNFKFWKKSVDKKIFIASGILFFVVITYFLLPAFYNEEKVKNQLKNQISQKYNLEVKLDKNLRYGLFPKPHFFIEGAEIEYDSKVISNSKYTKFFISSKNNLRFNKTKLNDLVFIKTNFKINKSNFDFFLNLSNNKTLNGNIRFIENKIFYLNQYDEIVFFSDLKQLFYLYKENLQTEIESKLNIFNVPVKFKTKHDITNKNVFNEIDFSTLKFKIENDFNYDDELIKGEIELNFINKRQTVEYSFKKNKLIFNTIDKKFTGDINTKPFFLLSNLNFRNIGIKKIFASNSILINFLKSEIIYNKNLNGIINITVDELNDLNNIDKINFDLQFEEGSILISNLNFIFKNNTVFNFNNVSVIVDENELRLIGQVVINFKDIQNFYNHFQIIRNYRKNIQQVTSNFIFNFDDGLFEFNELNINGIDKKISDKYLNKFNTEKKDIFNKVILRNSVKEFFKIISSE